MLVMPHAKPLRYKHPYEHTPLVLAVFRFTFGRPKVNRGVRGRVAPETPLSPGGETPHPGVLGRAVPTRSRIENQ